MLHLRSKQTGSALLITILVMGILMTLTLSISNLVIREIRVTQTIVDANKAYYAAEAGTENALLALKLNAQGYETAKLSDQNSEDGFIQFKADGNVLDQNFAYQYKILNSSYTFPDFPDDQPLYIHNGNLVDASTEGSLAIDKNTLYKDFSSLTFKRLGLNETAVIPLFSTNGETGETSKVKDFIVQYYVNFDKNNLAESFKGIPLDQIDIMRWKLYGSVNDVSGLQRTESIADIFPAVDGNAPMNPVCIGTDSTLRTAAGEQCILPLLSVNSSLPDGAIAEEDNIANLWSAARECYISDAGQAVTQGQDIKKATAENAFNGCNMRDFVDYHDQNYLVLTNYINPDIIGITNVDNQDGLKKADIYYRVLARECDNCSKLVREKANIQSNGFAALQKVIKSLNVDYKAPGFLPVFNFSLYKVKDNSSQ